MNTKVGVSELGTDTGPSVNFITSPLRALLLWESAADNPHLRSSIVHFLKDRQGRSRFYELAGFTTHWLIHFHFKMFDDLTVQQLLLQEREARIFKQICELRGQPVPEELLADEGFCENEKLLVCAARNQIKYQLMALLMSITRTKADESVLESMERLIGIFADELQVSDRPDSVREFLSDYAAKRAGRKGPHCDAWYLLSVAMDFETISFFADPVKGILELKSKAAFVRILQVSKAFENCSGKQLSLKEVYDLVFNQQHKSARGVWVEEKIVKMLQFSLFAQGQDNSFKLVIPGPVVPPLVPEQ